MKITTLKAIRLKCLECSCGSATEVTKCPVTDCSLWPFRKGRKPTIGEISEYTGEGEPVTKSAAKGEIGKRMAIKLVELRNSSSL